MNMEENRDGFFQKLSNDCWKDYKSFIVNKCREAEVALLAEFPTGRFECNVYNIGGPWEFNRIVFSHEPECFEFYFTIHRRSERVINAYEFDKMLKDGRLVYVPDNR